MKQVTKPRSQAVAAIDRYRAAQIVWDRHGERAEAEIVSHLAALQDRGDTAGVQLWLGVLTALKDLQRTRPPASRLH
jgi:hypothetical protein